MALGLRCKVARDSVGFSGAFIMGGFKAFWAFWQGFFQVA